MTARSNAERRAATGVRSRLDALVQDSGSADRWMTVVMPPAFALGGLLVWYGAELSDVSTESAAWVACGLGVTLLTFGRLIAGRVQGRDR